MNAEVLRRKPRATKIEEEQRVYRESALPETLIGKNVLQGAKAQRQQRRKRTKLSDNAQRHPVFSSESLYITHPSPHTRYCAGISLSPARPSMIKASQSSVRNNRGELSRFGCCTLLVLQFNFTPDTDSIVVRAAVPHVRNTSRVSLSNRVEKPFTTSCLIVPHSDAPQYSFLWVVFPGTRKMDLDVNWGGKVMGLKERGLTARRGAEPISQFP